MLTFKQAQAFNEKIYGVQNSRFYSARSMAVKIGCYTGMIIKSKRKGDVQRFQQGVTLLFSWIMAISNKIRIKDLGDEFFARFPGYCPYCISAKCVCGPKRPENRSSVPPKIIKPNSINSFREMLGGIYSHVNTFDSTTQHLAEEAFELLEQVDAFDARHTQVTFEEVTLELVDVLANLFAVLNSCPKEFDFDIESRFLYLFENGCYWCKSPQCHCGFTIVAETTTKK